MTDIHWWGATEVLDAVQTGQITPREAVEGVVEWIDATHDLTRELLAFEPERILADLERVEQERAAGRELPLAGLTFTAKDLIAVEGLPLRANSAVTDSFVAASDAAAVHRLRSAGAICLGKAATHEFAWGILSPPSRNPWDGVAVTGGSSGGSGAAVSSGHGQLSLGTDCGCSVRNPAALNGICGLRPTYGLVSTDGVVPLSMTMDTVGPLARSVADIALVLDAVADSPAGAAAGGLGRWIDGLRLGIPRSFFFDHLEDGVRQAVDAAIETLCELGMVPVDVDIPSARYSERADVAIVNAENATLLEPLFATRKDELGADVQMLVELGNLITAKDYLRAQQVRTLVRREFDAAFHGVDVIVAPAIAATAKPYPSDGFAIEVRYDDGYVEDASWAYLRLNMPASLAGVPSLVVPCGLSDGMPVGMQLIAPAFGEAAAVAVGDAFQRATEHHLRRPAALLAHAGASA